MISRRKYPQTLRQSQQIVRFRPAAKLLPSMIKQSPANRCQRSIGAHWHDLQMIVAASRATLLPIPCQHRAKIFGYRSLIGKHPQLACRIGRHIRRLVTLRNQRAIQAAERRNKIIKKQLGIVWPLSVNISSDHAWPASGRDVQTLTGPVFPANFMHLCEWLWYWPAAQAARQCQSGVQGEHYL